MLTVGSLFAGIGGFDLGFERAGYDIRWQVEIDPWARAVLAKHWPDVHRHDDIRTAGAHNLETVDVLCGGFPCTDISLAGKGAGITGPHSGLWSEYARLIRELRPRYVVVENVSALLVRGIDRVLGDLAAAGYDCEWTCIRASDVGAPHLRKRVWIVAYPMHDRREECALSEGQAGKALPHVARGSRATPDVADPGGTGLAQRVVLNGVQAATRRTSAREVAVMGRGVLGARIERSAYWLAQSRVCGVVNGLSHWMDGAVDGDTAEGRPGEGVPMVRRTADPEAFLNWPAGGPLAFPGADVLRPGMPARGAVPPGHYESTNDVFKVAQAREGEVRSVRGNEEPACPPSGRRHHAQRTGEPRDAVRGVPQPPPLCPSVSGRVDRLRGLGNALVPQIAEFLAHRILDAEARRHAA